MKRISKIEKDKILRWEDIPLSAAQLKRIKVLCPKKCRTFREGSELEISGEKMEWLRNLVENFNDITIDVDSDYDGCIDEIKIYGGDYADIKREESDEEYNNRMDSIKQYEFENLLRSRELEKKREKKKKNESKEKEDDEYKLFLRLEKKFRK